MALHSINLAKLIRAVELVVLMCTHRFSEQTSAQQQSRTFHHKFFSQNSSNGNSWPDYHRCWREILCDGKRKTEIYTAVPTTTTTTTGAQTTSFTASCFKLDLAAAAKPTT